MSDSFPLARYFTRIGYHGPAEPTLDVLRQLHLLHPQAIPFENIDAYSGLGVSLTWRASPTRCWRAVAAAIASSTTGCSRPCWSNWAFASRR